MRFKKYSPLIAAALAVGLYASATSPFVDAAVSRIKTWGAETLTSSDLNSEFNNILNNGEDLGWPATKAKDLNGFPIILDADADTSITADTDDRIDFRAGGQDIVQFDGTTASSVNFLTLQSQATGVAPQIEARGEANTGIEFQDSNGAEALVLGSVASAVNELTVINAATGNTPIVRTTGEADIGIEFQNSDSEEILILAATATSVNEVTITSQSTGVAPTIAATGETNVDLNLVSKGTGVVQANGATVVPTLNAEVATTSGTAVSLSTTVPSWVTRITLLFEDVSGDGTEEFLIQIGPSGGLETSAYVGPATLITASATVTDNSTAGFIITGQTVATQVLNGKVVLELKDSANNTWISTGNLGTVPVTVGMQISSGVKSLAGALTQITITSTGTPDDFDGGSIALVIE